MLWLVQAGGAGGMLTLVFGLVTLVNAALFARRPDARRRGIVAAMGRATTFAAVASLCGGVLSTLLYATGEGGVDVRFAAAGVAESLASPVMGFALVSLSAMLEAIGARREVG
ncbi:MAG: hypothetical protein QM704_07730 [Anaeromyxobacteraceae bacterium]